LKFWYAIYVKSKTEKRVASELSLMKIDNYLPLRKVLRQWSDRKKWIEDPLFKSYVFVNIEQNEYYTVLQTPGVVKYISFEGKAVPIPPQQIDAIKYYLEEKDPEQPKPTNWSKGQHVEVISGSMTGLTGKLVAFKGKHWLGIEIETIGHSIVIQIQKNKLRQL